jgi:diguanylate cyclase (GGDEF)-like protein
MTTSLPVAWVSLPEGDHGFTGPVSYPGLDLVPVRLRDLADRAGEKRALRVALMDVPGADRTISALDIQAALASCPVPALVRIPPDRVAEVLPVLRRGDAVCLPEEPLALLVHRVRQLLDNADLDPLTHLLDRRPFYARLESALLTSSPERPLSLLFLDLDHFKRVNQEHGYPRGDRVLEHCARLLPTEGGVLAARLSGDEFALIVPGLDEPSSCRYAGRLCALFADHPSPDGIAVTVSIGVDTTEGPVAATDFVQQAATALYAAKGAGRNQAVHFRAFERAAVRTGGDVRIHTFETIQRVVSERAAETIARRGRQLLEAFQNQAERDGLTGLFNRGYLDRRIAHVYQEARGSSRPLCVALIDIDYFGSINKTRGWPTGDRTLREIADLVRRSVRSGDWVARYGGEEIAVVLPDVSCQGAAQVLERIREAVARHPFRDSRGEAFSVTLSAGVVELQAGETLVELWQRLSDKLLGAKNAGRNQVRD